MRDIKMKSKSEFRKVLVVEPDECGACRICEVVCSLVREGECNPAKSRIQILRKEMLEVPLICQQCEVLFCASVCPEGAIGRDENTGAVLVDEKICNGCGICIEACPFKAVIYDSKEKKVLICDLCRGNPQCVEWCPRESLQYLPGTAPLRRKKTKGAQKCFLLLNEIRRGTSKKIQIITKREAS